LTPKYKNPNKIGTSRVRDHAGSGEFALNNAGTCAKIDTPVTQRIHHLFPMPALYQRDDGLWALSLADESPGFETIAFACAVAADRRARKVQR
jgi:hypothetical protein